MNYLELGGKTGILVPAIRKAVEEWRKRDYAGATATSKLLLNYWFPLDGHVLPNGQPFKYYATQQEAIETLIYIYEVAKMRRRENLIMRFRTPDVPVSFPSRDDFCRYAIKMATGSGKTKVMAMVMVWQYLCSVNENKADYADTFLLIAPNVIVFERLQTDFAGGRIFKTDPLIPRDLRMLWNFQCYMRGESERGASDGALYLTNIQQLYEREETSKMPDAVAAMMGATPGNKDEDPDHFISRIVARGNCLVLNDEAHHTHDEYSEWNNTIHRLDERLKDKAGRELGGQFDFSATPRYNDGRLFSWIIYDYPLRQAIIHGIVKRPIRGVASGIDDVQTDNVWLKYKAYLTAGVERWREYTARYAPKKRPILFIMMNSTKDADAVAKALRFHYPSDFTDDKLLVIHTNKEGDVTEGDLIKARKASREVDNDDSSVNCIVSVLMLREGWDVRNVTVIVGLRPYSSEANILPEQTVGRGLRLMQPGLNAGETVDVIGTDGFMKFVGDLEKIEGVKFDTFKLKDPLALQTVEPLAERAEYDIAMPFIEPLLVEKERSKLGEFIEQLDVMALSFPTLPLRPLTKDEYVKYEGYDLIDNSKQLERSYKLEQEQTANEVIGYYTEIIKDGLKLPASFAALLPKVYQFVEQKLYGRQIDLSDPAIVKMISTELVAQVVTNFFLKILRPVRIEQREVTPLRELRPLSSLEPFVWGKDTVAAHHTVFNLTVVGNDLENRFAQFLDLASDVQAFAKIPDQFGFSIEYTDANANLRHYFPDFVARQVDPDASSGYVYWLIETKGLEGPEVPWKDQRAKLWAEQASEATGYQWRFLKVPDKQFKKTKPATLADLAVLVETMSAMLL